MLTRAWRLLRIGGTPVLLCLICDRYSANLNDIRQRSCGYCHRFLTDVPECPRPAVVSPHEESL